MNFDDSVMPLLVEAEKLKTSGQFPEAIKMLQQIIVSEHNFAEAYEELADNYLSLREINRAEKALNQALHLNSDSPNAHYLLGFLYSVEQKWIKSVEELELADNLFPNHPEILRCLGWSIYNQNRKNQGLAVLERSQSLNPADPNILCDLGVCYMNSANFDKAEKTFEKVIRLAPNSDQAIECSRFLAMLKTRKDEKFKSLKV